MAQAALNTTPELDQSVRAAEKKSVTVVADTNVVVSATFWPNSHSFETKFKDWCFLWRVIILTL
jgi:hypothetical protein